MSQPVSLFSGYGQRENRVTNYCLLVLKLLYEENPKFFAEVLRELFGSATEDLVGVQFRQQAKTDSGSIPDGVICQAPFTVYVETKNYDWFYNEQLEQHLQGLVTTGAGLKILIALGGFECLPEDRFARIQELCATHYEGEVVFKAVTFEKFADALQLDHLPKNLADTVGEFVSYLRAEGYFSSWEKWLDVVNCASSAEDVLDHHAYLCPAKPGAYKHGRCKFFGMYRDKCVSNVALIEAVVEVDSALKTKMLWNNSSQPRSQLTKRAVATVAACRPTATNPHRVFLLGPLHPTSFRKQTKGGMFGSKRYFDIGTLSVNTAEELATALDGRDWAEFE
jgi:hypothetical protein